MVRKQNLETTVSNLNKEHALIKARQAAALISDLRKAYQAIADSRFADARRNLRIYRAARYAGAPEPSIESLGESGDAFATFLETQVEGKH
jgi:hypothetical protein